MVDMRGTLALLAVVMGSFRCSPDQAARASASIVNKIQLVDMTVSLSENSIFVNKKDRKNISSGNLQDHHRMLRK
jgi:hypothetical protein